MGVALDSITRLLGKNRRRHVRHRRKYDTIVRDEGWREVFRGKTLDVSCGGARIAGFPAATGVHSTQKVTIEFLLIPKDEARVAERASVPGHIIRVDEREDAFILAVEFDETLSG